MNNSLYILQTMMVGHKGWDASPTASASQLLTSPSYGVVYFTKEV
jgi:hypothetical protein